MPVAASTSTLVLQGCDNNNGQIDQTLPLLTLYTTRVSIHSVLLNTCGFGCSKTALYVVPKLLSDKHIRAHF